MNAYPMGNTSYEYGGSARPPPVAESATGKAMFDGYRGDILNGFESEAPRHNPLNSERPQSSALVDLKDPIQVHLLTETALGDSKKYEVLSQEEVDGLKKQCQSLSQRIESTRTNLTIQSKYRDAAISMARLYSPSKSDSRRRSLLGHRASGGSNQGNREAELEREACERKCEDLAAELFSLEKRMMGPQRRLLEHTAGILQLTHKVSKRKAAATQNGHLVNGVPGSPESLYTYSQSRNSLDIQDDIPFENSGLYLQDFGNAKSQKNAIEIPQKSPVREQHQLREEMDRIRGENRALRDCVSDMEQKLEQLNGSLRETIVRFDPAGNSGFLNPPSASTVRQLKPGDILRSQVEYLESGLVAVQAEQDASPRQRGNEDTDKALTGLWDMIQSGLATAKQRKDDRRRARLEKGLEDDEEMSDDDDFDAAEPYSVTAFDTRVRWLYRQATTMKDQRSVLKRQIKQQRELNNKSDAEKDEELERKEAELEQHKLIADRAEKDAMDAQKMLSEALQDLEDARAAASGSSVLEERAARVDSLEAQLREMEGFRSELDTAHRNHSESERIVEDLRRQLEEKDNALRDQDAAVSDAQKTLKAKEEEMERLNIDYAELKTEVTIARAELDGAYGSRAERAADAAKAASTAEVDRLRDELTATVKELEDITKETIASEREKVELEGKLDDALAAKASLDAELKKIRERMAKLQEDLDGERLKAHPGQGGAAKASSGASMLSEQFRATMREERKKFQEDIREERAKNHRLEEELARLKRAQGPGKSPLSPR